MTRCRRLQDAITCRNRGSRAGLTRRWSCFDGRFLKSAQSRAQTRSLPTRRWRQPGSPDRPPRDRSLCQNANSVPRRHTKTRTVTISRGTWSSNPQTARTLTNFGLLTTTTLPHRNRWFARLAAGGEWIRTCSTAARKPRISEASRSSRAALAPASVMWHSSSEPD